MQPILVAVYFLASLAVAPALVIESPAISATANYGHYATYVFPAANQSFDIHVRGYTGDASIVTLNASDGLGFSSYAGHFTSLGPSSSPATLQERDVCAAISSCYGYAADAVATTGLFLSGTVGPACSNIAIAVSNYFTANNYANVNAVLQGSIIGFAVNIASTAFGNAYLNAEVGVDSPNGKDQCNAGDPATVATDYAAAIYTFCQAIQSTQNANTDMHFAAGEFADGDTTIDGRQDVLKAFVAAQAGNYGPVCSSLGITWRRAIIERMLRFFSRTK